MKKILIFYASYGGGHLSAAKSIEKYINENYEDIETHLVDCMEYINVPLNKLTTGAYRQMAKKVPKLWKMVYFGSEKGLLAKVSKNTNQLMSKKLLKLINEISPNYIISTHFFSSQMVNHLKLHGKITTTLATILTDFAIHNQWLIGHEQTNYFFVSNEAMKQDMITYGIDINKIYVTGIPMSGRFFEKFDTDSIFDMFTLDKNKKVILFFGGGEFGLGKEKTLQVLESFIQNLKGNQIVAIAGKNEKMKEDFESLVTKYHVQNQVRVLGFTDKVPELMHIASFVVTKPGGLTTTESLACELPIIIVNPIPGQEEENAEFLEKHKAGIWIRKEDNPNEMIVNLFQSSEKLEEMRENVKLLSKKDSTKEICKILLGKNP